jgi:hypothetical protein
LARSAIAGEYAEIQETCERGGVARSEVTMTISDTTIWIGAKDKSFARLGRNICKKEADALIVQLPAISAHFGGEDDIVLAGDTNFLEAD